MANLLEIIVKAKDEASNTLKNISTGVEKFSGQMRAAGLAMAAVGAAGLKVASDARKMNADLGYTGKIIGATNEEMRAMALEITNVTFGVKTVITTFEQLARAGVRDQDTMKQNALAFDALADATKSTADVIADTLIPAYKMFGVELPKTAREMDKWTYLVTTTNVSLTELGGLMGYIATYGQELNLSAEQVVLMMKAMAEQGRSASDAARLLRTGIKQATGDIDKLWEILGITNEELEIYAKELRNAEGVTADLQKQQESQYTVMDKLKQKYQELTLALAPILEGLEPVFSVMTALGGASLTLTYALPPLVRALSRLRAAMKLVSIEAAIMWGAITLGISVAVTAIVEMVNAFKDGAQTVEDYNNALDLLAETMKTDVQTAANSMISSLQAEQKAATDAIEERRRLWKEAHWERMSQLTEQFFAELMVIAPEIAREIKPIYENWQAAQESIERAQFAINRIDLEDARIELEKLKLDPEATERDILQMELTIAQLEIPEFDKQFQLAMERIRDEDIDKYFDSQVTNIEAEYERMIAPWMTLWEDEFTEWATLWESHLDGTMKITDETLKEWMPRFRETWEKSFPEIPAPEYEVPKTPLSAGLETVWNMTNRFLGLFGITRENFEAWHEVNFGMQHGGIVTRPLQTVIGEAGPEAVIPLDQSGLLGTTVNVHVQGSVVTEQQLVEAIYDQLLTKKRYNAVLELS